MKVRKLISNIEPVKITGDLDKEVNDIYYDSRQVKAGGLFVCIEGLKTDGHNFINKAVQNGAVAVLIDKEVENIPEKILVIQVDDTRKDMSLIAAAFFDYPLGKLKLIGITGTNGKTTTTYLIKSILEGAGIKTGLIGTIKNIIGNKTLPAIRTTPESVDLYRLFSKMVKAGITHVVMEVSSHALDLKRVYGMKFTVGVFTNITQDHLDFHNSIEDYLNAKMKLFKQLKKDGFAVINADDSYCEQIQKEAGGKVLTYGLENKADLEAGDVNLSAKGVSFNIYNMVNLYLNIKFTGLFNVYNCLAAAASAYALGVDDDAIKNGLESIIGVPGRFELVDEGQEFAVVVDYAHTPDGMENVLKTALEFVTGHIYVVFGCGGDRDKKKRPIMGKMAVKYGDYAIITSDNPRSEKPEAILKDIEKGIVRYQKKTPYKIIADREEAIFQAVKLAEKDDMVLIFGKGHETYQIFKDKTVPFDDREVAREAIKEICRDDDNA
ncbi:MAG: UDP-N-acetylmuramoyl-L-alanyl-D-glutamate--2,6-diaminopimelate ligase [Halothermotrichaceae bacterium]